MLRDLAWTTAAALALIFSACSGGGDTLLLGATTSVQDPGLLDEIVRGFEEESGFEVTPVVGGSGQILEMARRGELDVVITHSPQDEELFVADGEGVGRTPFMENYFLVAGPSDDPAQTEQASTLAEAFERIGLGQQAFISRGDNSGTHRRELTVWQQAAIDPKGQSWYQESAAGQGQTLLLADERRAYTLVDSSTFTVFRERVDLVDFVIDREEPNIYSVIRVNPAKHGEVNAELAQSFADFITSTEGRCLIADFGVEEYGESLFSATCTRSNTGG